MCDHPAARALTGYLLVRGGVHQVAYARALENLTGANLTKLFPTPRIPTAKIPECQPHIEQGEHLELYRFSPDDYKLGSALRCARECHRSTNNSRSPASKCKFWSRYWAFTSSVCRVGQRAVLVRLPPAPLAE
jgi:Mn-containing catalase